MYARLISTAVLLCLFTACSQRTEGDFCHVLKNKEAFVGKNLELDVEATFVANSSIISSSACQRLCAMSEYSSRLDRSGTRDQLIAEIGKMRKTEIAGISADMTIRGYISRLASDPAAPPSFVITKVVNFKMREPRDAPRILCGNDMLAEPEQTLEERCSAFVRREDACAAYSDCCN